MGRAKTIDKADLQEVLSLRDDFGLLQRDNVGLRIDVSRLQEDVQSICSKQGEISLQVCSVEKAVLELGKQLSAMNMALTSIVAPSSSANQGARQTEPDTLLKSPTLQQEEVPRQHIRRDQLRQQLEAEKEKTRQLEELQMQNLPPIRTSRTVVPPGFNNQVKRMYG
ncbi:hypothetical protein VPH35_097157 [Triticum aestivum]|uniref:Uncharacterized protein n=1 Tax=Aegilops tauschii TaxID=37682 RepID=M8BY83_AEGTA